MYKGTPRLIADFSAEITEARGNGITPGAQKQKQNPHQPRILCPEKLSFKNKGEIKTYQNKQKLREFVVCRPVL